MTITSVQVGNTRKLQGTFTNSAGAVTDPVGAITLTVTNPAGTATVYTYALAELTKASTGVYYRNVLLSTEGTWIYIIAADGDGDTTADISGGTQINVVPAGSAASATLLDCKSLFYRYMGQLWTGTATSGSTSTLVDPNLVDLGSEEFPTPLEGKQLRITSTITDLRRIAKVDHATGTLYPNAVFSSAPTTNTFEIWGNSIHGGDALTRLFNDVLQVAKPLAQTELTIVTGQHIYDATALGSDPADIVEVYTRAIDSASLAPYTPTPLSWWQVRPLITTGAYGVALEISPAQALSDTVDLFVEHYKKLADFTTDTSTVDATYAEWLAWEAVLRHTLDKGIGSADRGRWADLAGRAGANVREYRRRFMPIKTRRAMHGRPQAM